MIDLAARLEGWRTRESRDYVALLALGAVDAAAYSVIAPVLPAISRQLHAGPALIGALAASFSATMILSFAVAGRFVRRGHTTIVLRASLLLMAFGAAGFVFASGLWVYLGSRALMGFASGGLWIGITFATLERWPGQEYVCMSRVFAAYSIGGLVGPALGAIGGIRGPYAAYLALVLLGFLVACTIGAPQLPRRFEADPAALKQRGFWVAAGGIVFAVLALGIVEGVLPLHLATHLSQSRIGALYIGLSLVVSASAAAAGSVRPRPILLASTVLVVCGLAAAGASSSIPIWLVALALAAIGIGLANTGSLGVLIETVRTDRIVTAMVVWSQLGMIGYLLGPLAGGALTQAAGFATLGLIPLAAAAALLLLLSDSGRAGSRTGP